MDPMANEGLRLLQVSAVLFALAAAGGLLMAGIRFGRKTNPPAWLAMLHGLLAGAGITLLAYAILAHQVGGTAVVALLLLAVAAAGGVAMSLLFKWKQILLPTWLVLVHAGAAVAGFVLLLYAAFLAQT